MEKFDIPVGDNDITSEDVKLKQIRITRDNKRYFPDENCTIIVVINSKEYDVKLRCDVDNSNKIDLTKEAARALDLKPDSKYNVRKLSEHTFEFIKSKKEANEKAGLQQELLKKLGIR